MGRALYERRDAAQPRAPAKQYHFLLPQKRFSWPRVTRTSALPPSFPDGEQYLTRMVTGGGGAKARRTLTHSANAGSTNRCDPFSMRPTGLTTGVHRYNGESIAVDNQARPPAACSPGFNDILPQEIISRNNRQPRPNTGGCVEATSEDDTDASDGPLRLLGDDAGVATADVVIEAFTRHKIDLPSRQENPGAEHTTGHISLNADGDMPQTVVSRRALQDEATPYQDNAST